MVKLDDLFIMTVKTLVVTMTTYTLSIVSWRKDIRAVYYYCDTMICKHFWLALLPFVVANTVIDMTCQKTI